MRDKERGFAKLRFLMGGDEVALVPIVSPLNGEREEQRRHLYNSVNALSFGFVATAILISMFLVMAIFERLLRARRSTPPADRPRTDLEAQMVFNGKLNHPSPKVCSLSL
jgi:hypothetical protein